MYVPVLSPQHLPPPASCPLHVPSYLYKVICTAALRSFIAMFNFHSYDNINLISSALCYVMYLLWEVKTLKNKNPSLLDEGSIYHFVSFLLSSF